MNAPRKNSENLSWSAFAPAPFESAWSIFLKVLSHNYIDVNHLKLLIQHDAYRDKKYNPLNFSDSRWIDFNKFGMLLGVDPGRLKNGFLDQLGFDPPRISNRPHKIRHCRKCVMLGYHCTLFDLSVIAECPWHRCALTSPCEGCTYPTTLNGVSRFLYEGKPRCSRCGVPLSHFLEPSEINKVDSSSSAMILGYCIELCDWWKEVCNLNQDRMQLLSRLQAVGEVKKSNISERAWQLGYALKDKKSEIYWKFSETPIPAEYREWHATLIPVYQGEKGGQLGDDIGRNYRSIRRHIYKKFVRPHRKCLSCLLALNSDAALALKCDSVCTVALAFLVWRMSIERVSNIERMKSPKKRSLKLRLMEPDNWSLNLNALSRVCWSYFGFFGLWYELDQRCRTEGWVTVEMKENGSCNGFFQWNCIEKNLELINYENPLTKVKFQVLYPVFNPVAEKNSKCIGMQKNRANLIDFGVEFTTARWRWATDSRWGLNRMFRLNDRARGRSFDGYLYV
jgi:hypothetical protein